MVALANSSETNRLLQRALGSDRQALEQLFARHRERLRKMVRLRLDRRVRSQITSSTVLEEVYAEVVRRIGEYLSAPRLPFFPWLRLVTGQKLQDLHARFLGAQVGDAGQDLTLYRGALPQVNSAALAAQLLGNRAANHAAVQAEQLLRLQTALNGMDAMDREVLALCHFEELSNDETAVVLGIERATASTCYLRALKALKDTLSRMPGFLP
jgi:RNA polymerase sigma-70 factor (ECF subfamily)